MNEDVSAGCNQTVTKNRPTVKQLQQSCTAFIPHYNEQCTFESEWSYSRLVDERLCGREQSPSMVCPLIESQYEDFKRWPFSCAEKVLSRWQSSLPGAILRELSGLNMNVNFTSWLSQSLDLLTKMLYVGDLFPLICLQLNVWYCVTSM